MPAPQHTEDLTGRMTLRLPPELKAAVHALAETHRRSANNEVVYILECVVASQGDGEMLGADS